MQTSRSDRVVRALTTITSLAYFGMWFLAIAVLVALPVARLSGAGSSFHYSLELPVSAPNLGTAVNTIWGSAPLEIDGMRGRLQLPIATMPWALLFVLWLYAAAGGGLMLLVLRNLRSVFRRVRDGAAFDVQNVLRLRTLGALLMASAALNALAEAVTAMVVRRGLSADSNLAIPVGVHVDATLVLVGLAVMALAEVFRRGAELEHEQSLVI